MTKVTLCKIRHLLWVSMMFSLSTMGASLDCAAQTDETRSPVIPKERIEQLEVAVQRGSLLAMATLGSLYMNGVGVEPNSKRAIELLNTAAKGGHSLAQNNLGVLLYRHKTKHRTKKAALGVQENAGPPPKGAGAARVGYHRAAAHWFERAANQGLTEAQVNLAQLYEWGQGVEQSTEKALEIYKQAAEAGNAQAHRILATVYFTGRGVERNVDTAAHWASLAAVIEKSSTLAEILPAQEPESPFENMFKPPENMGAYFKYGLLGWMAALLFVWLVIRILDSRNRRRDR